MGFRINTNIAALNAHNNATMNNRAIDSSLSRLSSGLRINTAADDASGMAIADSLRSQANSLGQAVRNANDAIGIIQTADKAMDEQLKILDTIKTKAIQAASDTQTAASREAIQNDVNRLIEQLDNIAKTTTFNGQVLLSGKYSNKEFQIGAFSNQTVQASIGNTQSIAVGTIATETQMVELGNTHSFAIGATVAKGSDSLQISTALAALDVTGLAVGDTIRIDGQGDFTIAAISGASMSTGTALSAGTLYLDRGLDKTITNGDAVRIAMVQGAADDISKMGATGDISGAQSLSVSDMTGFALGDEFLIVNSAGATTSATVVGISHGGTAGLSGQVIVSFASDISGTLQNSTIEFADRGELGTNFTQSDFLQYTVEGVELTGVQMTDEDGNGVSNSGLGRIADLINEATTLTGVKAVASVEVNSLQQVQGGQLASDITINGVTILTAGTTIQNGDTDNALVNAINDSADVTGVSASLEADGTLTLTSDGRAMNLGGLGGVAGITDGVVAGTLTFTKNGGGEIDVTSAHYTTDELRVSQSGVNTLSQIEQTSTLSDLVFGQKDSNGDGTIDNNDAVGLLRTAEGAMEAMDIVEAAIAELDATRADMGSVQNQLVVTVNNISVTAVNVKAAESQIRDVDFAAESATFAKHNILAQSGSYAMSQANAVQQNVLRLLQ